MSSIVFQNTLRIYYAVNLKLPELSSELGFLLWYPEVGEEDTGRVGRDEDKYVPGGVQVGELVPERLAQELIVSPEYDSEHEYHRRPQG